MSGREWQPGDVAMATVRGRPNVRVVRSHKNAWVSTPYDRTYEAFYDASDGVRDARPLVVIDPEDREQVERLDEAYKDAMDSAPKYFGLGDVMQAALRSLIAPPKPPEPTGLGAVVEDAEGVRWTRYWVGAMPWIAVTRGDQGYRTNVTKFYWEIEAVKVLAAGWSE